MARANTKGRVAIVTPADDSAMDEANDAVRVNVVAGGAGGGTAQLAVRNAADAAWVNVGFNAANLSVPATIGPSQGSLTNRSGSITLGGTSQQLAAALATRKYFFLQNIATEDLWFNFGTAAVADQPSIRLTPGDAFAMEASFVSTEAINIIGATTGSKFVAKEG